MGLRSGLGLFANLRPATLHQALADACPLKPELVEGGMDILIVRELTGGIYFGERGTRQGKNGEEAYDVECYSTMEIERIARVAFEAARKRDKRLCSVDKANVLDSSRLWRKTVTRLAAEYPVAVITGVNLPMLIEVHDGMDEMEYDELARFAVEALSSSGRVIYRKGAAAHE